MSKLNDIDLDELEQLLDVEEEETSIDWAGMFRKLYAKRKLFLISFIAVIVIVYPLARMTPKFYRVEVKLAPEFASMSSTNGLSSLMRSFGLSSMSSNNSGDAILPTLYPDLMNSKAFQVSLFDVKVKSKKGDIQTTYYDYLLKHQKEGLVSKAIGGTIGYIFSLLPGDKKEKDDTEVAVNAGALTKEQSRVAMAIARKVVCDVDDKTGVITIDVTDQDPVICATIADSTCAHLQNFITEYRTKKARIEMQDAKKQYDQTKVTYDAAKQKAESFSDSNWDLVDEDMITEQQALKNDMQMAFSNMQTFNQQYLAARSKYESMRPVYTVLDGASVPLRPAGPSSMPKVMMALILVLGFEAAWILYLSDFLKKMKTAIKEPEEE